MVFCNTIHMQCYNDTIVEHKMLGYNKRLVINKPKTVDAQDLVWYTV